MAIAEVSNQASTKHPQITWEMQQRNQRTSSIVNHFASQLEAAGIPVSDIRVALSPDQPLVLLTGSAFTKPLALQIVDASVIDKRLEAGRLVATIDTIEVAHQGSGIGTRVVTAWEDACRNGGIATVVANNVLSQAKSFWENQGYTPTNSPGKTYFIKSL